ncbi:TapY2 family type IVa secretion system protein [Psychromonas sp. MME2]|uniref:TapY2 family type IVa secretion system protein n=1 Tax=unclassified Psychromonas TaxID=2614957 RepID=UPI00339BF4BD
MNIKSTILLLTLFISPIVAAKDGTQSELRVRYKCYLNLSNDSVVVHHFVSDKNKRQEFEKSLSSRVVFAADGITSWQIKDIYECVPAKQVFANKKARELEAKTPF